MQRRPVVVHPAHQPIAADNLGVIDEPSEATSRLPPPAADGTT